MKFKFSMKFVVQREVAFARSLLATREYCRAARVLAGAGVVVAEKDLDSIEQKLAAEFPARSKSTAK